MKPEYQHSSNMNIIWRHLIGHTKRQIPEELWRRVTAELFTRATSEKLVSALRYSMRESQEPEQYWNG